MASRKMSAIEAARLTIRDPPAGTSSKGRMRRPQMSFEDKDPLLDSMRALTTQARKTLQEPLEGLMALIGEDFEAQDGFSHNRGPALVDASVTAPYESLPNRGYGDRRMLALAPIPRMGREVDPSDLSDSDFNASVDLGQISGESLSDDESERDEGSELDEDSELDEGSEADGDSESDEDGGSDRGSRASDTSDEEYFSCDDS